MQISFVKYQGTGNDFIMIDHRDNHCIDHSDKDLIAHLCHRRFGIGADGLILLEKETNADFRMVYFNADGLQSTMCGNGGRCIIHFAWTLGIFSYETIFMAVDGKHEGILRHDGLVSLKMADVDHVFPLSAYIFELNTGSPHYVTFCTDIPSKVREKGAEIRYAERYRENGINVNFVRVNKKHIEVATYERGVEDETLSCGTGVTAAAISSAIISRQHGHQSVDIQTKGGQLSVSFERSGDQTFRNIWLTGPAVPVFTGHITL